MVETKNCHVQVNVSCKRATRYLVLHCIPSHLTPCTRKCKISLLVQRDELSLKPQTLYKFQLIIYSDFFLNRLQNLFNQKPMITLETFLLICSLIKSLCLMVIEINKFTFLESTILRNKNLFRSM